MRSRFGRAAGQWRGPAAAALVAVCGACSASDATESLAELAPTTNPVQAPTTTANTHASTASIVVEQLTIPAPTPTTAGAATTLANAVSGGVDGPVIFGQDSGTAEDALFGGTLSMLEGCLVAIAQGDTHPILMAWPYGTRWDPDSMTVVTRDGSAVPLGAEFYAGGGHHSVGDLIHFAPNEAALAAMDACQLATGVSSIFIAQSTVEVVSP